MNFYIYSITYLGDGLEERKEEGLMAASSYSDAVAEIEEWDLSVDEIRLKEVCGEYQGLDCERPWVSISDLKEAFEEAGIQLSSKPAHQCGCEKKDKTSTPSCGGDYANDR